MRQFAYERVLNRERMPGLFIVLWTYPVGPAIAELETVAGASFDNEWENQIRYLPLS